MNMVTNELEKISVVSGECRYNFMCHRNAVHDALNANQDEVAMCFYIDDDQPIIHFINIEDGRYVDNTLGRWSDMHDYYLIKTIGKEDFFNIADIFVDYRKQLQGRLPILIRWFNNIDF